MHQSLGSMLAHAHYTLSAQHTQQYHIPRCNKAPAVILHAVNTSLQGQSQQHVSMTWRHTSGAEYECSSARQPQVCLKSLKQSVKSRMLTGGRTSTSASARRARRTSHQMPWAPPGFSAPQLRLISRVTCFSDKYYRTSKKRCSSSMGSIPRGWRRVQECRKR